MSQYLYAIVAPDGTEIFSIDLNRPDSYYPEDYSYSDGIDKISSVVDKGKVEYFNLQGIPVTNPASGSVCICRQGEKVEKVMIR